MNKQNTQETPTVKETTVEQTSFDSFNYEDAQNLKGLLLALQHIVPDTQIMSHVHEKVWDAFVYQLKKMHKMMCRTDVKHKIFTKKPPKVFYEAFAIVDEFMIYIEKENDDFFPRMLFCNRRK